MTDSLNCCLSDVELVVRICLLSDPEPFPSWYLLGVPHRVQPVSLCFMHRALSPAASSLEELLFTLHM